MSAEQSTGAARPPVRMEVTLPLVKVTPGALRYGLPASRKDLPASDIYIRKDKLQEAGHIGPWPAQITVTVEVRNP